MAIAAAHVLGERDRRSLRTQPVPGPGLSTGALAMAAFDPVVGAPGAIGWVKSAAAVAPARGEDWFIAIAVRQHSPSDSMALPEPGAHPATVGLDHPWPAVGYF